MTMRRRGAMIALIGAAIALTAAAPANERLYDQRFADLMASPRGELSAYDPTEAIRGSANVRRLPLARADQRTISAAALASARDYASAANSSAFMVVRNGRIEAEDYFGRTREDTIVSKSLAKPLTAIAIGRAIALGRIKSLDQPVSDFIPEWRGSPKAGMKIRHLLDMRSGFLAQGFSRDPDNHWARAYLSPDHERYIIDRYPLTDVPGSVYEYSNATSELVAPIIERATGMRYADFIGREVLAPIGAMGGSVWVNRVGGTAHAGCCTMLPPETWLRLGMLVLQDGRWDGRRLLPRGFVTAMRTGTAQNPYYGLGLWLGGRYIEQRGFINPARPGRKVLHSEPYLADDVVMFDGNSNQVVWIIASQRMVVLRTGDNPPNTPEWDNTKLPNLLLRGIRRDRGESEPAVQRR